MDQRVMLGAGVDTFAQRRQELASKVHVFAVDRPGPKEWKRRRLIELGFGVPERLHFVPVDFEGDASWREQIVAEGFAMVRPAVVASTGDSMYLTRETNVDTLRQVASLAPESTFAMSFLLPFEHVDATSRAGVER